MKQWYTLYTKPNAEYRVAAALQQWGIETYLPEMSVAEAPQGQRKKPFFPCYLFMRVDLEVTGLSKWQWTPGLRRIVSFGGRPVPLSDQTVDLIRQKLEKLEVAGGRPAQPFQPGDTVRITEGPLQDMLATFDSLNTPGERAQVLLAFLGRVSRVRIDVASLEKVSHEAGEPAPKRPRRTRGRGRRIKTTTRPLS